MADEIYYHRNGDQIPFNPAIYIPGGAKVKMSARTTANGTHKVATMINGWVKI